MNATIRHDHIDAAIEIVRACGPVGIEDIAREIRIQASNGTPENCHRLAQAAIDHGLSAGWLALYDDDPEVGKSYQLASL